MEIVIVNVDGEFVELPSELAAPATFKTSGIPAIYDFASRRSYVGAEACMLFLDSHNER
jgi:hypothetical protein